MNLDPNEEPQCCDACDTELEDGLTCPSCGHEHEPAPEISREQAGLPQALETRKPWKEMTEEEQDQVLATWAAKQPDAHLAELFLVNGFATAVARAGRMAKGETRRSVFEQVHDAVVAEAKRREQKKRGELT